MNPTRIWTLGAVIAVIAVIGGAVGLGVQPQLAAASAAKAATTQTAGQNAATQLELARLSRVAAKQSDLQTDADNLRWAIPRTLQLSTFATQLRSVAALDGVQITSLAPGDATPYAAPVAAPVAATSTTTSSTATPSPSASAAAESTTTAGTTADPGWFGKIDPAITATNFLVIPVTIIVTGEESAGLAFTEDAQRMRRLFVADTVTFQEGADADSVPTTTISGEMYALKR